MRQVRAEFDSSSLVVYQAYRPEIAAAALKAGRFVPPFSLTRMTWIKPSFLWMMERSGWANKSGQERVLAVRLSRSVFESLLEEAELTHPQATLYPDADTWRRKLEQARVQVQWDPERDLRGQKLNYRSLQVGISRHLIEDYALRWVLELRDMTPLAHKLKTMLGEGKHTQAEKLLPRERLYPLPSAIARRLGVTPAQAPQRPPS